MGTKEAQQLNCHYSSFAFSWLSEKKEEKTLRSTTSDQNAPRPSLLGIHQLVAWLSLAVSRPCKRFGLALCEENLFVLVKFSQKQRQTQTETSYFGVQLQKHSRCNWKLDTLLNTQKALKIEKGNHPKKYLRFWHVLTQNLMSFSVARPKGRAGTTKYLAPSATVVTTPSPNRNPVLLEVSQRISRCAKTNGYNMAKNTMLVHHIPFILKFPSIPKVIVLGHKSWQHVTSTNPGAWTDGHRADTERPRWTQVTWIQSAVVPRPSPGHPPAPHATFLAPNNGDLVGWRWLGQSSK